MDYKKRPESAAEAKEEKAQRERFIEAARELGCDESDGALERSLERLDLGASVHTTK